jgi:hypothetical protein
MNFVPEDTYIDAASGMVGLTIPETWRPGVRRFLGIAAEMAAVLEAVPLQDGELALAPVYRLPGVTHDQ